MGVSRFLRPQFSGDKRNAVPLSIKIAWAVFHRIHMTISWAILITHHWNVGCLRLFSGWCEFKSVTFSSLEIQRSAWTHRLVGFLLFKLCSFYCIKFSFLISKQGNELLGYHICVIFEWLSMSVSLFGVFRQSLVNYSLKINIQS